MNLGMRSIIVIDSLKNPRRYWINTIGEGMALLSAMNFEPDDESKLLLRMKECSKFTYYLFKYTRINLLAKDKFFYLKLKIKGAIDGYKTS